MRLERVRGREYAVEEAEQILEQRQQILMQCILPLDRRHALILVEDTIIQKIRHSDANMPIFFPGLIYSTEYHYAASNGLTGREDIDELRKIWSPDDEIVMATQRVGIEVTNGFNYFLIGDCTDGFSFSSVEGLQTMIHNDRPGSSELKRTLKELDFIDRIDFEKDMPKEMRGRYSRER